MKIKLELLQSEQDFLSSERRQILVDEMAYLEHKGVHCFECTGECCTFTSNSMQTTPIEAVEVAIYLLEKNRVNGELLKALKSNIRSYRLDSIPGNGQRSFMRRTYTCPFFLGKSKGCSLSRSIKPYGCLGFNPNIEGQKEGGDCGSNIALLEQREARFEKMESRLNTYLKEKLNLYWDKLPFPVALLDVLGRIETKRIE